MPDQHDHDLSLSQFWNELTERGGSSTSIDPEAAALIRRLHVSAGAPLPGSARERVWRGLLDTYEQTVPDKEPSMHASVDVIRPGPNGRIGTPHPISLEDGIRPTNRRIALAIAAILVIALVGGIAGGLIRDRLDANDPRPGPAILAPGTPSPEAQDGQALSVEFEIPAGELIPSELIDDKFGFMLIWVRVPANLSGEWKTPVLTENPGYEINSIVSGTLTLTLQDPAQVIRTGSDGTPEDVAAGESLELGPGDTIVHRLDMRATWASGNEPVDLVSGHVVAAPSDIGDSGQGWEQLDYEGTDLSPVPTGPVTLRLRKVDAEPDVAVPVEPGETSVGLIEAGASGFIGSNSDGSITLKGAADTTTVYVLSVIRSEGAATPAP